MPMTVTAAPAPVATLKPQAHQVDAPAPADSAPATSTVKMAADQFVASGNVRSTTSMTLSGSGNTVSNSNNNITIINNFQGRRPKGEKPAATPKRENFFQLIGRAYGQLLNTLSFGFFSGLSRGLRGEGAPTAAR